jgi:curved DNA-binding protein
MEYKDYYRILNVDKNADEKEIKRAYRKLAREYHPDKNPDDKVSEEKFKEINEAYEVLGNPENRTKYDQLGRNYHRYQQMGGAPGGFDYSQWAAGGSPRGQYQQVNIDVNDLFGGSGGFSDFFNTIFGNSFRSRGRDVDSSFGRQAQTVNLDMEHRVNITLEEAYHGTSRTLSKENGETFTAKIPPGAKTGTKIRLRGKGLQGPSSTGDLYLIIRVEPHDTFKRDGEKVKVTVPIDVITAVLGGKVNVPTLAGSVKLTIPSGTQGGRTFRLKGKGMPALQNREQFGDLFATIQIRVPDQLSEEEQNLYEQLADLSKSTSS